MKKRFTLLSAMMIATSLSFAQVSKSAIPSSKMETGEMAKSRTNQNVSQSLQITPKSPGDLIWQTNLTSTSNWMFTSDPASAQGPANGWRITSTETPPFFSGDIFNSTSGGNYATVWNGNITTQPAPTGVIDAAYIMLFDSVFNLSAYGSVNFEFQQYGALFVEDQVVEASINGGTTWIEIGTNTDMGSLTATGGAEYPNPSNRSYNLNKAFPAGANFSAVKFRFKMSWDGNLPASNKGIAYGWFVDDIKLVEGADHDLNLKAAYALVGDVTNELMYTKFPLTQINANSKVTFSADVYNEGPSAETTTLNVTSGAYTGNSSPVILTAFDHDSISVATTLAINPTLGNQNFDFSVTSNNPLTNTGNDTKTVKFEVTSSIMAVDGYNNTPSSMTGAFTGWQSGTGSAEIGTIFEIFEDATVGAIKVAVANIPSNSRAQYLGNPFSAKIYDMSGTQPVEIGGSLDVVIAGSSFGKLATAYMVTPVQLTAGNTYMVTASIPVGAKVPIGMSGQVIHGNVLGFSGTDLVSLLADQPNGKVVTTPIIRLDFTDYTGVNEIAASYDLNVYPNPFSSNTEVAFELKNDANVSINVTDITGRTVSTVDSQMYTSGAHTVSVNGTNLTAGVYNCTITIGNNVITKRIVKK